MAAKVIYSLFRMGAKVIYSLFFMNAKQIYLLFGVVVMVMYSLSHQEDLVCFVKQSFELIRSFI